MAVEATCAGCGQAFQAKRRSAKWCSDRCRKQARRADPSAEPESLSEELPRLVGLVETLRAELDAAGIADTVLATLALELAARLCHPDSSGISGLSRELRVVRNAALEQPRPVKVDPEPTSAPTESDLASDDEDDVTRARRLRVEARQAAGLA